MSAFKEGFKTSATDSSFSAPAPEPGRDSLAGQARMLVSAADGTSVMLPIYQILMDVEAAHARDRQLLNKTRSQTQQQLETQKKEIEALKNELVSAKEEAKRQIAATNLVSQQKVAAMEKSVADAEGREKIALAQLKEYEAYAKKAWAERNELSAKLGQAQQKISLLENSESELQRIVETKSAALAKLEADKNEIHSKAQRLEAELAKTREELMMATSSLDVFEQESAEAKKKTLQQQSKRVKTLELEIHKLSGRNEALHLQVSTLQAQLAEAQNAAESAKAANEGRHKAHLSKMLEFVTRLQAEVETLRTVYPVQDVLTVTETQIERLEHDLRKHESDPVLKREIEENLLALRRQRDTFRNLVTEAKNRLQIQQERLSFFKTGVETADLGFADFVFGRKYE